jgi:phosphoribosylaminoimidazolecarboxamide formyltransferase/IMP cyclohydrolase
LREAYVKAYEADPVSAFGSVIGLNREIDAATATELAKLFVEAIAAPSFSPEALEILGTKKNLRLLAVESPDPDSQSAGRPYELRRISGGLLLQEPDSTLTGPESRVVTKRQPSEQELQDLNFGWRVVKHVKSNAIVLARGGRTLGVGAGQMSRVDSVRISIQKAGEASKGAALSSDAFFPFRDGIDEAGRAGVTAIIQPGGSVRDDEVIAAADEYGITMIFTGLRHFKH